MQDLVGIGEIHGILPALQCYESFDLSKTHFLSTQDLVKISIDPLIYYHDHRKAI